MMVVQDDAVLAALVGVDPEDFFELCGVSILHLDWMRLADQFVWS
jgi:hypothetical protein